MSRRRTPIPADLKRQLAREQGWHCAITGRFMPHVTFTDGLMKKGDPHPVVDGDHIIPVSRGGPHSRWNIQLVYSKANSRKKNKMTPKAEKLAEEYGMILIDGYYMLTGE